MPNLSPSLLAVLRCPVTGSALVQDGDSLVATTRAKDGTTHRYAIEDGIPVLLAPEHTQAGAAPGDQHESSTAQEQHA